jgi:transketolase
MRNTFISELLQEAIKDPSIVLLAGDLGYGVTDEFSKRLPEQYINFGINEQSMMSAAAGMASKGFKPFVYSIGNFPTFRCMEQIRNDVSYMNLNVTILAVGAGFAYGTAGYSHHLIDDIGAMSSLPNMKVFSPADTLETLTLLPNILSIKSPKYIRLGKGGEGELTKSFNRARFGISILEGSDQIALCSTGNILAEALSALGELDNQCPLPTVLSIYDFQVLELEGVLAGYKKILVVEEHIGRNGFGTRVLENIDKKIQNLKSLNVGRINESQVGSQRYLRHFYKIDSENIAKKLIELWKSESVQI